MGGYTNMVGMDAKMKLPISVVMITKNEEAHIRRALQSASFADDVIVIDAQSSDRTVAIAKECGARVVERVWTNFGDQRNFSLTQAKHPWVLVVDADEAISSGLVKWLEEFFRDGRENQKPYGYKIRRAEYFLGKLIQGACWNPSYQDRFFRKDLAKYVGEIHEYPITEGDFVRAPETAFLDHNPFVTVESFFSKMNHYTSIEALDRYRQGQRTSLPHLGVVFFSTWVKNYFYYKGYRDGAHGFVICLMEAVSRTVRHIKLWQMQKMEESGQSDRLPIPKGAAEHRSLEAKGKA